MPAYTEVRTARTWDSYRDSLLVILKEFKPMSILEYGPGESTRIMQDFHSTNLIDSIEHNPAWGSKGLGEVNRKVKLTVEADEAKYPYVKGRCDKYDIIFVDGIARSACLMLAPFRLRQGGIAILHDAERPEYKKAIDSYSFKFPVDEGHTMILTNDQTTAIHLSEILWLKN